MWIYGYIYPGSAPEYWISLVWLVLILLVGLVANSLLLVTILKANYVRGHNSAVLLLGLCCADLYMMVVAIPLYLTYVVSGSMVLGRTVCLASYMTYNAVSFIALWSISLSSIDRLLAVSKPLVYRQKVTLKRMLTSLAVLCLASVAASSPLYITADRLNLCSASRVTANASRVTANASDSAHVHEIAHYRDQEGSHVYLLVYELACPVLPLLISVMAYFGIFLAARNLRKREIARKKMIEEVNRRKMRSKKSGLQSTLHVQQPPATSLESGIHMEESTLSDEAEIEEAPIARINKANCMSPELLKTIRFSNHTVFLESLERTFFSSTLIEDQLNRSRYEEYFTDCLMDVEKSSLSEQVYSKLQDTGVSDEEDETDGAGPAPADKVGLFRWNSRDRSRTERLRIKTAILLNAVLFVMLGSHLPASVLVLTHRSGSVLLSLLPLVVYAVNPLLFGFLNNTLRNHAVEMITSFGRDTDGREDLSGRGVKQDSLARLKKWRRRLSQASLLRDFSKRGSTRSGEESALRGLPDPALLTKQSNISVLSDKSILRDQMTMRYFETNL